MKLALFTLLVLAVVVMASAIPTKKERQEQVKALQNLKDFFEDSEMTEEEQQKFLGHLISAVGHGVAHIGHATTHILGGIFGHK